MGTTVLAGDEAAHNNQLDYAANAAPNAWCITPMTEVNTRHDSTAADIAFLSPTDFLSFLT